MIYISIVYVTMNKKIPFSLNDYKYQIFLRVNEYL